MKCNNCNVEMIGDCIIEGQHPFQLGVDGRTNISIKVPTNEKGNFLGIKYDKTGELEPKARFCPKCGRLEFYIEIKKSLV